MRLKELIRDFLHFSLGRVNYIKLRYFIYQRKILNLKNPISYTEKIQFRKLNSNPKRLSIYADKLSAKRYISSLELDIYIPKTLYSCSCIDKNKLNEFKGSNFVIKTSHGGGGNFIDIFNERDNFDSNELEKKYNNLIKIKTGEKIDELFYDIIKPSIFIEENLNSLVESDLVDYKFHVFNGEVKFIQLNHRVSLHDYTMTILNKEYKKLPFTLDHTLKSLNEDELCKPFLFEKAIHLAEEIAQDFNYLRVDFYLTDNEVIFGEMTLCPSSGYSKVSPSDWDNKIGSYWNIEKEFFNESEHSNFVKY